MTPMRPRQAGRNGQTSLYVTYSRPAAIARSDILHPIHAGRSSSTINLALPGDNSGENISDKNGLYCELTTHFWAWKNDKISDVLGFFHYRRFLDLSGIDRRPTAVGTTLVGAVNATFASRYGLTKKRCRLLDGEFDVIAPRPVDVKIHGADSVFEQYDKAPDHFVFDLVKAKEVVRDLYPSDLEHFEATMAGRTLVQHNIYVMKREVFEVYSEWLFAILAELEQRIDTSTYSLAGRRVYGYVAERLFTAFIRKLKMEGKRIVYTNLVFVDDLSPWQRAKSKVYFIWRQFSAIIALQK